MTLKAANSGYVMKCALTGRINDENETTTYCTETGQPLTVEYNEALDVIQYPLKEIVKDPLRKRPTSLIRLDRLSERYGVDMWAKLEFENPTGCFKDRGSYIEVLKAIEMGKDAICLASTGNMAASVAAYACYFDIPCYVFVPEKTNTGKLAQAAMYNARILKIKGDYSTCEQTCREFAKSGNYYLAGDYVFRGEGQKSFTWELVNQEGGDDFDYVIVPVGCGTNFGAIYKGYKELEEAGKLKKKPKMVATQPEQSSPVVEGIFKKEKVIKDSVSTYAGAVAAADPVDFIKVLQGIEDTDGLAFTVTEDQLLVSLKEMTITEGHFTEPACALPLATIKDNLDTFRGKKCLLVLTGSGLKDPDIVTDQRLRSPVLPNNLDLIDKFIESGYLKIQNDSWGKERPNLLEKLKLDAHQIKAYYKNVEQIKQREKKLNNQEKEVLLSLLFNDRPDFVQIVEIKDYHLNLRKEQEVEAFVEMEVYGEEVISKGIGVGPVDAVLEAVKSRTDKMMPVSVTNFNMEVLSDDTEALVVISFTLKTEDGQEWVSRAASPDMIEATLEAFTKGLSTVLVNKKTIR